MAFGVETQREAHVGDDDESRKNLLKGSVFTSELYVKSCGELARVEALVNS